MSLTKLYGNLFFSSFLIAVMVHVTPIYQHMSLGSGVLC